MEMLWVPVALFGMIGGPLGLILLCIADTRRHGKILVSAAFCAFVAVGIFAPNLDHEAHRLGFASAQEQRRAQQHGITDPAAWNVKSAELEIEAKRKVKRAGVITGTGLEVSDACTRWENVEICRHHPTGGLPDYLFYRVQPIPAGGCAKGIERWAQANDIDPDWINMSVLLRTKDRCEFNQVPVKLRSPFAPEATARQNALAALAEVAAIPPGVTYSCTINGTCVEARAVGWTKDGSTIYLSAMGEGIIANTLALSTFGTFAMTMPMPGGMTLESLQEGTCTTKTPEAEAMEVLRKMGSASR